MCILRPRVRCRLLSKARPPLLLRSASSCGLTALRRSLARALAAIRALYDELRDQRGYALEFNMTRVSFHGTMLDAAEAAERLISDGDSLMVLGPNRGG